MVSSINPKIHYVWSSNCIHSIIGTSSITESDIRSICVQLGKKWSCRDIAKALGQDPSLSDDCSKVVTIWLRAEDNIPKTCKSLADTLSKKLNSEFKFKKGIGALFVVCPFT